MGTDKYAVEETPAEESEVVLLRRENNELRKSNRRLANVAREVGPLPIGSVSDSLIHAFMALTKEDKDLF